MIPCLLFGDYYPRQPAALATPAANSCGPCLHVGAKWENDVLMVNRQAKPLWQDAVPPRDTVLPVPAGVEIQGQSDPDQEAGNVRFDNPGEHSGFNP